MKTLRMLAIIMIFLLGGCSRALHQGLREEGIERIVENNIEETQEVVVSTLSKLGYQIDKLKGCNEESIITARKEIDQEDEDKFGTITLNWGLFPHKKGKTLIRLTGAENLKTLDGTVKTCWLIIIPIPYGITWKAEPLRYGQVDEAFINDMLNKVTSALAVAGYKAEKPHL